MALFPMTIPDTFFSFPPPRGITKRELMHAMPGQMQDRPFVAMQRR